MAEEMEGKIQEMPIPDPPKESRSWGCLIGAGIPVALAAFIGGGIGSFMGGWWGNWAMVGGIVLLVAMIFLTVRELPHHKLVSEILYVREKFPAEAWGDPERAETARRIAEIVALECGLRNGHFRPEDSLRGIFAGQISDGAEGFLVFDAIYSTFKLGAKTKAAATSWFEARTFGEFVDRIMAAAQAQ